MTNAKRVAQLDCVLSVLQQLVKTAPDETAVYLQNKIKVDVGRRACGAGWQVAASHSEDDDGLHIGGIGLTVREAIDQTIGYVRAVILGGGSLQKAMEYWP